MRHLRFVLPKRFAVSAPEEKLILKHIFTEEESEEADEVHVSKMFGPKLYQKFAKQISWIFYIFQI